MELRNLPTYSVLSVFKSRIPLPVVLGVLLALQLIFLLSVLNFNLVKHIKKRFFPRCLLTLILFRLCKTRINHFCEQRSVNTTFMKNNGY